jgi:hypothetical protein
VQVFVIILTLVNMCVCLVAEVGARAIRDDALSIFGSARE